MTQKFAQFNETGFPTGFYDSNIHGKNIPKDAVKITNEQWNEFVNNQGSRIWQNGKVVEYVPSQEIIDSINKQARIFELKSLLSNSDYKFTDDYDEKNTPEWLALKEQRQQWRYQVRNLQNS